MSEKEKVTTESPFHKVLESWADEVIEQEKSLPEFCSGVEMKHGFTLKNGMQVQVIVGRDILEDD